MNRRALRRVVCLLALLAWLSVPLRAAGIQARVAGFKRAGTAVRVALDVQNVFGDRFRGVVERGQTLYLRIETELWEPHAVWDRLVRPATVSVARVTRDAAAHGVVVVDAFGEATTYASLPRVIAVWADLVPVSRVDAARTYYVHATVTLGTIAESETSGVSDAVFGSDRQSSGLGALGKYVFRKVMGLADYLDSSSCEVKSARTAGDQLVK